MPTPNRGIPYVPEGTLDPAAGLNLALNVIDALLQTAVISIGETVPPATAADGDLYIVGVGATGAWTGQDNNLARFVDQGNFWEFFTAGSQVFYVINLDDGLLYKYMSDSPVGWIIAAGIPDAPSDGLLYARRDGAWESVSATFAPVFDVSDQDTVALTGVYGNYTRFSHASATYHFADNGSDWDVGAEYHGRYVGSGVLSITSDTGFVVNPPAGGSLQIPPGGTFTVKIVAPNAADLFGVTVPAT